MAMRKDDDTAGGRRDERAGAERTLVHDAEADREYTTPARTAQLDRESPGGEPGPAPGDDRRKRAVERHAAPGAEGADLDAARALAARDLEEEGAGGRGRETGPDPADRDPSRRR